MSTKKSSIKHRGAIIGSVVAVVLLGALITTAVMVYSGGGSNSVTRMVERIVPMPAAVVGWTHIIPVSDVRRNVEATRSFYENQDFASIGVRVDFTTEDGQKKLKLWEQTLLDKLIEDEVVYILAKRAGIEITDAQVHARVKQELDRYGKGRIVQKNIRRLWGFTLRDFEERVVKPQLYREALEKYAQKQYNTQPLRQKALEAHTALSDGMDFSAAVQKYSDSAALDASGNAGWFAYDDLLPEIAEVAMQLKIGESSNVIEAANGFHIIKVEDRRSGPSGDQVLLRHIIILKPTFAEWLDEQMKRFSVRVFLPAYTWDAETRHVILKDPELIEYANQLIEENVADYRATSKALQQVQESQDDAAQQ